MCPKGGFPSIRHNEVRDLTAELLSELCHNIEVESYLQPLNGETFQYKTANSYSSYTQVMDGWIFPWTTSEAATMKNVTQILQEYLQPHLHTKHCVLAQFIRFQHPYGSVL